ncbi:L-histidine N(alpha)-methyltransferase [Sutcliffiella horikoshii]|uniref:L-histidine N(Alpha)-methyltransferase n=1 Tax=Sutcliffiella horikoshii TaxID=79883 RepID=A0A5D4SWU3_9BACI|nr:L-histidine N(alpha)-methyltransferase [Sutcliffiella horikoshii]TYS67860.1 L-histidine N(alpha)-methyltransferase [Sutcliffiella horikoshii]
MRLLENNIQSYDFYIEKENMREEIVKGLSAPVKTISSKYLYDHRGSELFEMITELEEYYPTRTEMKIFNEKIQEITMAVGDVHTLIEYGSGSSNKIKALLHNFASLKEYVPIDISRDFLFQSSLELAMQFPHITIKAVCGDYTGPLTLPLEAKGKKVIFFPGSTIGNFEPVEVRNFLMKSAKLLDEGDGFLIGVDMKKDSEILEKAYDDGKGITAAFNLNLLTRMNRELGANFNEEQFEHLAYYNKEKGRIEMHLESQCDQRVNIGDHEFSFREGETIHTENSYKYSIDQFQTLAMECGFEPSKVWTDDEEKFSVHYLKK